jgi:predicted PurR-regulated permease PerM
MQIKQYPFYLKATVILMGIVVFVYALYNLQTVLIPLAFAMMIGILLNPLFTRLQQWKVPRVIAIILTLIFAIIVIGGILYFLSTQIAMFADSLPLLKQKFIHLLDELKLYLKAHFGISIQKQVQLLNEASNSSKGIITNTLGTAIGTLGLIFLIPVYVFLFLFYKPLILNFFYEVFAEENSMQVVADVLKQTKSAIQSYMVGLLLEALIVAIMNSVALLILGVPYAILLGVIGAILNMLPYIGGIIAIALPVLIATATKDGFNTQLGIIAAYAIIQFIDNNILVPRIVSSKVQINALISIVIVLLGGSCWGVAGMFLSIPFVAILKIICDRIEELKPWGKLLGDEVPTRHKGQIWNRIRRRPVVPEKVTS